MSDKKIKILEKISNILDGIVTFVIVVAMILFALGENPIKIFIFASYIYICSYGLKLIVNKNNKILSICIGIIIVVLAAFCGISMIKWSL